MAVPSSPPRMLRCENATTPPQAERNFVPNSKSSESLPDLRDLLGEKHDARLKSGSRIADIPSNSFATFQSASFLVKYKFLDAQEEAHIEKENDRRAIKEKSEVKRPKKAVLSRKKEDVDETKAKPKKTKQSRKRKSSESHESVDAQDGPRIVKRSAVRKKEVTEKVEEEGTELAPRPTKRRRQEIVSSEQGETLGEKKSRVCKVMKRTTKSSVHFAAEGTSSKLEEKRPHDVETSATCIDARLGALENMSDRPVIVPQIEAGVQVHCAALPVLDVQPTIEFVADDFQKKFAYEGRQNVLEVRATASRSPEKQQHNHDPRPLQIIFERNDEHQQHVKTKAKSKAKPKPKAKPPPVPALQPAKPKEKKTKSPKKSPKKGPSGITARSIARFAQPGDSAIGTAANTSPHFAPVFDLSVQENSATKSAQALQADRPANAPTKTRKPRKKSGEGGSKASTKKVPKVKAVSFVKQKIVSPKQHDARLKRQDILFGTSSQLRMDESPTGIKQIQQALQASVVKLDEDEKDHASSPIVLKNSDATRRTKGKLWGESINRLPDLSVTALKTIEEENHHLPGVDIDEPSDLESESMDPFYIRSAQMDAVVISSSSSPVKPTEPQLVMDEDETDRVPIASNGFFLSRSRQSSPRRNTGFVPISPALSPFDPFTLNHVDVRRPALRPLSTNSKSPTKSPPKRGEASKRFRSSTFEDGQCAVQPNAAAFQSQNFSPTRRSPGRPKSSQSLDVGSLAPITTPKKRGRPPKTRVPVLTSPAAEATMLRDDSFAEFQHIDDIEDSECDATPSPPRRRGKADSGSPPLPLTTQSEPEMVGKRVKTVISNAAHPRWPGTMRTLFPKIRTTIEGAPPSESIKTPSWYQKILLYDPIVIEDLTAWLNDQGLRVEGKNSELVEISGWMVQLWCESNSVCCLWKEGLRGGVRVRY